MDIADAIKTLGYLFLGGSAPACLAAVDTNDDGMIDIADPLGTLTTLFQGGSGIAAPYPLIGTDPTPGDLPCGEF